MVFVNIAILAPPQVIPEFSHSEAFRLQGDVPASAARAGHRSEDFAAKAMAPDGPMSPSTVSMSDM